jgi:hypothetical protein
LVHIHVRIYLNSGCRSGAGPSGGAYLASFYDKEQR